MNKGFGNEFNKKNNNQNKDFLVEDIELSSQTNKATFVHNLSIFSKSGAALPLFFLCK